MSEKNSNHEEDINLINNTPTENEQSVNSDEKKCCPAPTPQVEANDPEEKSGQKDNIPDENTPSESKEPKTSASTEYDSFPEPDTSADSVGTDNIIQQQDTHPVKNLLLQIWSIVEGLIKVFTFCIVVYTLLLTKQQVGAMQDQVGIMQDQAGVMQNQINEMQIDRNESYKAVITANPVQEKLYLASIPRAEDGHTTYDHLFSHFEVLDNTGETSLIHRSEIEKHTFTPILFANIGPGIAARVKFYWDNENTDRLYQTLQKYDSDPSMYLLKVEDYYLFDEGGINREEENHIYKAAFDSVDYSYMLPNLAETYSVELPIIYTIFFMRFLNTSLVMTDMKDLVLV